MPLKFCFDKQFRYVVTALTSRTAICYLLSSPLGNHCVFTQEQTPHSGVGTRLCPHWSHSVTATSPGSLQSLCCHPSVYSSPKGWQLLPSAGSLQTPSCSAASNESTVYRLCWAGTTSVFPHQHTFSSVQLHFLHALPFFIHKQFDQALLYTLSNKPISCFKIDSTLTSLKYYVRKQIKFIFISQSYKNMFKQGSCLF